MPDDLERFVLEQDRDYEQVVDELRRGRKSSHWIWFIFPQIAGLGRSPTARTYAISSLDEAEAYLDHPVLGPRLLEAAGTLADLDPDRPATEILGDIDAVKLRSSMTLFARAAPHRPVFRRILDRYFGGAADPATDRLLA